MSLFTKSTAIKPTVRMNTFQLNERLAADTYPITENTDYYVGLHKNALIPWLILVPKTDEIELFACEDQLKARIRTTVDSLADFMQSHFVADKMNIATLGNVVSQLHIHLIARKTDDVAWPDPVWGKPDFLAYDEAAKNAIIAAVQQHLSHA